MLTEYQEQLYQELGMCVQRHLLENDLTSVEVVGIIDLIKTEVREDTLMQYVTIVDMDDDEEARGF